LAGATAKRKGREGKHERLQDWWDPALHGRKALADPAPNGDEIMKVIEVSVNLDSKLLVANQDP
jgi:hypothetical protein